MLQLSKNCCVRRARLSDEHAKGFDRFYRRLQRFTKTGELNTKQAEIVVEHLLRLGERNRNPANTGNIEDLFCHTLADTADPIRAYAQVLADSVKVVPMDPDAQLRPPLRNTRTGRIYHFVRELEHMSEPDQMLVTHTMVAYGDHEMWNSAVEFVKATRPELSNSEIDQEVARMAVQSQHLPSSSFVLARACGLTVECSELWPRAGYSMSETLAAQRFYDICAAFEPQWTQPFLDGLIPSGAAWTAWRTAYLEARDLLPPELIYQLSSDTLTNFFDGTLESGKWTDASVAFHGVRDPTYLPEAIARIVNQYVAEHVALHNRPAEEIEIACSETLLPWGITFKNHRAVVSKTPPPKADILREQFEAAQARLTSTAAAK